MCTCLFYVLFFIQLIVSDIKGRLESLVKDKWGRHILHYLLKARDPQHVNKEIRLLLSLGDSNPFSKKDSSIREKELREEVMSYHGGCYEFMCNNNWEWLTIHMST